MAESGATCGEAVGVELGTEGDSDFCEGAVSVEGGVDGVVLANGEADFPFSGEAVTPRGDAVGVVVVVGSVEASFAGVVAGASGDDKDVPPKTVVPAPLLKVAPPPVFHAGTVSGLFNAAWPKADGPPEVNALNPPPALGVGVVDFASAGFAPPNVASPPDANVPNPPSLSNVDVEGVLIGVAIGVVDIGVPRPTLPKLDWPKAGCPNPD